MSSSNMHFRVVCHYGTRTFSDIGRVVTWFVNEYPYMTIEQRKSVKVTCGTADFTNVVMRATEHQVERLGWVLLDKLAR